MPHPQLSPASAAATLAARQLGRSGARPVRDTALQRQLSAARAALGAMEAPRVTLERRVTTDARH